MKITLNEAKRFLLLKQGLLGEYQFINQNGAFEYIKQAACLQFDPVDSCGKNAELSLQSRVKGFKKSMLWNLLYDERVLFDYPDKQLSIILTKDLPFFTRYKNKAIQSGLRFKEATELEPQVIQYINEQGAVSSSDLPDLGEVHWHSEIHWSGNWDKKTRASRAVLEQLYSTNVLLIHHKSGSRKYYDLAEKYISNDILNAKEPLLNDFDHLKWRVFRRIGAVGLIWNKPSDLWLGIQNLSTNIRNEIFEKLLTEKQITEIKIDELKDKFYIKTADLDLLKKAKSKEKLKERCEFLAPLDPFMWDRKLINKLFNFHYSWEIYTPEVKRKYGYYVLPIIYGENFIGRIEAVNDRKNKTLVVKNIWFEENIKITKKAEKSVNSAIKRFAKFNECNNIKGVLL